MQGAAHLGIVNVTGWRLTRDVHNTVPEWQIELRS